MRTRLGGMLAKFTPKLGSHGQVAIGRLMTTVVYWESLQVFAPFVSTVYTRMPTRYQKSSFTFCVKDRGTT